MTRRHRLAITVIGAVLILAALGAYVASQRGAAPAAKAGAASASDVTAETAQFAPSSTHAAATARQAEVPRFTATGTVSAHGQALQRARRTPSENYAHYIDAARRGDPRAQYWVAQAIQECRGAYSRPDQIEAVRQSGRMTEDQLSAFERQRQACAGLVAAVPDREAALRTWLGKAVAAGDVLAVSWDALLRVPDAGQPERHRAVSNALRFGADPEAYRHAVIYYANIEPVPLASHEAWALVSCEFEAHCDVTAYRAWQEAHYKRIEIELIEAERHRIATALSEERWGDIGF